jgi:hypothetical protein
VISHIMFHTQKTVNNLTNRIANLISVDNIEMFTDILKDNGGRLQTAVLNIINCFFFNISFNQEDNDDSKASNLRKQFAELSFLQIVGRIVEIGNLGMLRSKAMLCIQLICRYSPRLLINLSESRIGIVWSRLLETCKGEFPSKQLNPGIDHVASTYLVECTLSMIRFLRFVAITTLNSMTRDLNSFSLHKRNHGERSDEDRKFSQLVENHTNILAAVLTLVNSQSTLRREFFRQEAASFAIAFVQTVTGFEKIRNDAVTLLQTDHERDISSALLLCLESMAKVDYEERIQGIEKMTDEAKGSELELTRIVASLVFPIMLNYTARKDPESRVLVVSCIRNMFAGFVKAMCTIYDQLPEFNLHREISDLIDRFFEVIPLLLEDFSPIPQYAVHIVNDLLECPASAVRDQVKSKIFDLDPEYQKLLLKQ